MTTICHGEEFQDCYVLCQRCHAEFKVEVGKSLELCEKCWKEVHPRKNSLGSAPRTDESKEKL